MATQPTKLPPPAPQPPQQPPPLQGTRHKHHSYRSSSRRRRPLRSSCSRRFFERRAVSVRSMCDMATASPACAMAYLHTHRSSKGKEMDLLLRPVAGLCC